MTRLPMEVFFRFMLCFWGTILTIPEFLFIGGKSFQELLTKELENLKIHEAWSYTVELFCVPVRQVKQACDFIKNSPLPNLRGSLPAYELLNPCEEN